MHTDFGQAQLIHLPLLRSHGLLARATAPDVFKQIGPARPRGERPAHTVVRLLVRLAHHLPRPIPEGVRA